MALKELQERCLIIINLVLKTQKNLEIPGIASLLRSRFFGMSHNAPSKETAAHNQTTFLSWKKPITASVSFSKTFSCQICSLKLAQSENVFYLCMPSSEPSQMNMWISGLCLGIPKNICDTWMSFVFNWRSSS